MKIDDFLHLARCSLHPQLRHYSSNVLQDRGIFSHLSSYWDLPKAFRNHCDEAFDQTGPTGYLSWDGKCVFSFEGISTFGAYSALLRNLYVPRAYRGQGVCNDTLSQIALVAESSRTCVVAIVHPFEISGIATCLEAAIEAMHGMSSAISYVSDPNLQIAMNGRFKKAGFRNCDLRDTMSDSGAATIPLANQWIFVPTGVAPSLLASIADRFVNEGRDE